MALCTQACQVDHVSSACSAWQVLPKSLTTARHLPPALDSLSLCLCTSSGHACPALQQTQGLLGECTERCREGKQGQNLAHGNRQSLPRLALICTCTQVVLHKGCCSALDRECFTGGPTLITCRLASLQCTSMNQKVMIVHVLPAHMM